MSGLYFLIAAALFFTYCFWMGATDEDDPSVLIVGLFLCLFWGIVLPIGAFIGSAWLLGRMVRREKK